MGEHDRGDGLQEVPSPLIVSESAHIAKPPSLVLALELLNVGHSFRMNHKNL
jgi:hypothetical protein